MAHQAGQGAGGSGTSLGSMEGRSEYQVRLSKTVGDKTYHMMRFKPPHQCDLDKLINPTLERKIVTKTREEEVPESGEGSEYGRKRREEARRRRRGYSMRTMDPDDHPWVLQEKKKGGKHFIGRKEGTVNSSSSYFIFKLQDGVFEVEPVKNWYDFVPPVKYNYFDADEAEEEFEKRNKTLNYFSIMVSKKMKKSEEGEEEAAMLAEGKQAKNRKKKKAADSGLLLTDSDSAGFSSENDSEDSSGAPKGKEKSSQARKVLKKKKRVASEMDEAGEETDEGDMESREVDYMSDSSSNSEMEFLAKEANKELPKDDQEIERKEQKEIDQGFVDSSSSEDELTEKGKELKEIMKKLSGGDKDSSEEEEGGEEEEKTEPEAAEKVSKGSASSSKKGSKSSAKTSKHSKKRDRDAVEPPPTTPEGPNGAGGGAEVTPPGKKQKLEISTNSITEEEVRRYLQRRPITAKDLVRKFTSKKPDMDKNQIVKVLHKIIEGLENVEKQAVKDKMYLSLKTPDI